MRVSPNLTLTLTLTLTPPRRPQESAEECGQLEEALDAELQTHVFMQHAQAPPAFPPPPSASPPPPRRVPLRAQAYVEDLLACLSEKSPRVEACEAALCDALEGHHRASRAVQAPTPPRRPAPPRAAPRRFLPTRRNVPER